MGWSRIQSASGPATTTASTQTATFTTANVSSGTKIIAAVGTFLNGHAATVITSVEDGASNALTLIGRVTTGTTMDVSLWAMDTPAGDVGTKPAITVTASAGIDMSLVIQEVSGLLAGNTTAMADGTLASNSGNGGSSTGSPTYSSAASSEYLVSVYGDDGGPETWTKPAALTADANSVNSNGDADCAIAYGNSAGGAESASWALTGTAANWGTLLVAFKLAAAGGSPAAIIPRRGPAGLARFIPVRKGRGAGQRGIFSQQGPAIIPPRGPAGLADRAPGPVRKGRAQGNPGAPVNNPAPTPGPPIIAPRGPAGLGRRAPGPFRKGRSLGNQGTSGGSGPALIPPRGPAGLQRRAPGPQRKGRWLGNPGAPVTAPGAGPPLIAQRGPAGLGRRAPGPWRKGRWLGNKGAPVTPPPSVNVINTWTSDRAITTSFVIGAPASGSLDCPVASGAGSWLIAYCSWTLPPAYAGATMAVADDTHGYWVPLGAPSGDSSAAGFTRCSIWARPASAAVPGAKHVYMAPVGMPGPVYPAAMGITVIEVTGMSDYAGIPAVVTASINGTTAISANAAAPTATALMLTVAASDAAAFSSGPGSGWNSVTGVSVSNVAPGILYTSPAWRTASVAETASWSTGTSGDLSACTATILVSNAGPAQPNPAWPATQLQLGLGSGALTPPSEITWTDITPRLLAGAETSSTRGKQYELDQTQSGLIQCTLDNNDGALTPGLSTSPFYPYIVADVPIRLLMTWAGRTYSVWSGYVERWPQAWKSTTRFGLAAITVTDAWSLLNDPLSPCQQEQIQLCDPYAFWTLGDAAGSGYGQNSAPGNSNALQVVTSKYGAAAATQAFGEDSGINPGDPSGTVWQQTGLTVNTYGYCLTCADQDYPPLTGGMTVAGWFDPVQAGNANLGYTATSASPCVFTLAAACTYSVGELVTLVPDIGFSPPGGFTANGLYYVSVVSGSTFQLAATSGGGSLGSTSTGAGFVQPVTGQAVSNYILMRGAGSATGPAFELYLANAYNFDQGQLYLTVWDKVTRAATTTNVNSNNWLGGALSHFALLITATTWQVIIDGGAFAGASGTCNLPSSIQWLSCMGAADRYATGQMMCGDACQVAVFPALLTADQVTQIALAGYPLAIDGEFGTEGPASRIERLAAYGGWAGPRAISTQSRTGMAGITDIQGTAGSVAADGVVTAATGQQANQAVTNIVTSDGGWMYADGNGVLCYLSRGDVYGLGPAWLLGEHAGEYPYSIDAVLGYDKQLLYNQAQLTQSTGTGTPVTSSNVPSETQHGVATYTQTVYQDDIGVVGDMANWIVNTRSTPAERAESLTVNAANNAANWPFVLGVEPAQPVQVARRPILASGPTVVQAIVAQVKRSIDFAAGTATVTIVTDAFPEGTVLTAGDPVLGLLNGENLLGW